MCEWYSSIRARWNVVDEQRTPTSVNHNRRKARKAARRTETQSAQRAERQRNLTGKRQRRKKREKKLDGELKREIKCDIRVIGFKPLTDEMGNISSLVGPLACLPACLAVCVAACEAERQFPFFLSLSLFLFSLPFSHALLFAAPGRPFHGARYRGDNRIVSSSAFV